MQLSTDASVIFLLTLVFYIPGLILFLLQYNIQEV